MTAAPTPPGDELDLDECRRAAQEMHRSAQAIRDERPDLVEVIDGNERIAKLIEGMLARIKAQDAEIERLKKYAALSFRAGRSEAQEEDDAR